MGLISKPDKSGNYSVIVEHFKGENLCLGRKFIVRSPTWRIEEVKQLFMKTLTRVSILAVIVSFSLTGVAWTYEWKVAKIGGEDSEQGPYTGGEVEFLPNGFIISATGGDVWSNKLGCTLAYIDGGWEGDFTIEYTIEEHTSAPATTWSKCGVMIAQDLDPETPYVFLQSTSSNDPTAVNDKGTKIITRTDRGGGAGPGSNGWTPLKWPVTYKVTREDHLFTAWVKPAGAKDFVSVEDQADGKAGDSTLALQDPVVLGIAINGHNSGGSTGTAKVVNIRINGENVFAVESTGKLATKWSELKAH
jgi:hypothetical protein